MKALTNIGKMLAILIILSIIITISPKLGSIVFMIVPIIYLIYLFKKGSKFKNYNFLLKGLISSFLVLVSITGIGGVFSEFKEEDSKWKQVATVKTDNVDKNNIKENTDNTTPINKEIKDDKEVKEVTNNKITGNLKVHYIDVGQGDSILIQQDGHNMLIDAGTNATETAVVSYLKNQGVTKLNYVIGTHPHEDHIGGLEKVIDTFQVDKVFMPEINHNTQTFKSAATSIKNKGLKITTPKVGDSYSLGSAKCQILAPVNASYDNLNNYSIVTKLKFGNNSFIFMGDAESLSEGEILQKQLDISSDVLKVGHHGSRTSTTQNFLDKINPKYAVISCGKGNKYGHPMQETLNKLKDKGIKVYRTDECSNVIAISDGNNITFNTKPGSYKGVDNTKSITKPTTKVQPKPVPKESPKPTPQPKPVPKTTSKPTSQPQLTPLPKPQPQPKPKSTPPVVKSQPNSKTVYITDTGKRYHGDGCRSLRKSKAPINKNDAINRGYGACGVCNP
ncbi:MBL fold metallo-hydrolase [Clostridium tetani]|uniref:MBL fold metallo-hydrolase n=1 Tax=Clostridium tetani TaxID=1513 RepID=UPI001FB0EBC4|nr:MBL fold metallo-hydrolase [Clostridium tetani]